jgi:hypothetical protein
MAKAMKWTVDGSVLTLEHVDSPVALTQTFDVVEIFPEWDTLTDVQQKVVLNGLKQKLADSVAVSKDAKLTPKERSEAIAELWGRLLEGEWNRKAEAGTRGPSVSLKTLVPALVMAGLTPEAIAAATGKSLEAITKFIETGEE